MVNVNMIDTMGYGIQRMFIQQRHRFYPLPDFDIEPTRYGRGDDSWESDRP